MCGLMSDLVIFKFRKVRSYMTMSLLRPGVIKQRKPNLKTFVELCGDVMHLFLHLQIMAASDQISATVRDIKVKHKVDLVVPFGVS